MNYHKIVWKDNKHTTQGKGSILDLNSLFKTYKSTSPESKKGSERFRTEPFRNLLEDLKKNGYNVKSFDLTSYF